MSFTIMLFSDPVISGALVVMAVVAFIRLLRIIGDFIPG